MCSHLSEERLFPFEITFRSSWRYFSLNQLSCHHFCILLPSIFLLASILFTLLNEKIKEVKSNQPNFSIIYLKSKISCSHNTYPQYLGMTWTQFERVKKWLNYLYFPYSVPLILGNAKGPITAQECYEVQDSRPELDMYWIFSLKWRQSEQHLLQCHVAEVQIWVVLVWNNAQLWSKQVLYLYQLNKHGSPHVCYISYTYLGFMRWQNTFIGWVFSKNLLLP